MTEGSKGFEIAIDHERHILKTRVWGEFDAEFLTKCQWAFQQKLAEISPIPHEWSFLLDLIDCSQDVRDMILNQLRSFNHGKLKAIEALE
jgi:hypothetical protein